MNRLIAIMLVFLTPLIALAQDRYDIPQTGTKVGSTRTGINSNFVFLFIAGTNAFRTAVEKGSNVNFVGKSPTNATQLDYCMTNGSGAALAAGGVSNYYMALNAILSSNILDGTIAGIDIGGGVISNVHMAINAITSSNIQNSTIGAADMNFTNAHSGAKLVGTTDSNTFYFVEATSGGGAYAQTGVNNIVPTNGMNAVESDSTNSVVLGGNSNFVKTGRGNFIGGGELNVITNGSGSFASSHNFLGGGLNNIILNWLSTYPAGVLVGGSGNSLWSGYSFVGGGSGNHLDSGSEYSALVGGYQNYLYGVGSFIGAGALNSIGGAAVASYAVVAGGYDNDIGASATYATVGGGQNNDVSASVTHATIGGGYGNIANGNNNTIAGGYENHVGGQNGQFIGGGWRNGSTGSLYSVIGGGFGNSMAGGNVTAILGGYSNRTIGGFSTTVLGGTGNLATGDYSTAAGFCAFALHPGSTVFADYQSNTFSSTATNQFLIRASGGVRIASFGEGQDTNTWAVTGVRIVTNANVFIHTPAWQGCQLLDVGSNRIYYAVGLTTNDWKGTNLN